MTYLKLAVSSTLQNLLFILLIRYLIKIFILYLINKIFCSMRLFDKGSWKIIGRKMSERYKNQFFNHWAFLKVYYRFALPGAGGKRVTREKVAQKSLNIDFQCSILPRCAWHCLADRKGTSLENTLLQFYRIFLHEKNSQLQLRKFHSH